MNQELAIEILDKLQKREIHEYRIKKEEFLSFQAVIVKRKDFKYFRGEAKCGGDIIYTYLDAPRS